MRTTTVKGVDGKTVVRYLPETEADVEELRRMAEREELDDRESFGDDPGVWEERED